MRKLVLGCGLAALALLLTVHAFGQAQWPNRSETRPVTQGGDWTISHIGSTVHVSGTINVGSGSITATTGPIPHISSVLHVAGYGTFRANLHDTATLAHVSSVTHIVGVTRFHYSGALRATQVQSCGTTTATVVATNTDRRDLYVKNIGLLANPQNAHTVFVGFGTAGHVALTVNNGYAIHAAGIQYPASLQTGVILPVVYTNTELILYNYQGPLSCISTGSGANLSVLEVLR